ncbi:MAG: Serine hydroxymethyltransferase [Parcubacteria group bacterium ADurb.Bin305]|nr:MAG: Serine hydroxymethyltransferase [Parcubacteria group bacterium ADurb.Bin305]
MKKYNFVLVTGGTDNHLILINLKKTQFSGILAEKVLEQANILANRNVIPGDDKAFYPSGLRLGVPWVTTLGMKGKEMEIIAQWIYRLLQQRENPSQVKKEVINLRKKFPFYQKYITI